MERRKDTPRPDRLSAQEKANLRTTFSDLLEQAASSEEAAQAALRACLKHRYAVPAILITKDNIANALSLREITHSLDRLSTSQVYLDFPVGLTAIRLVASKQIGEPLVGRLLSNLTKAVTSKLIKMATDRTRGKKGGKSRQAQADSRINFTVATMSSIADLALWTLQTVFEHQSRSRVSSYPLVLRWVRAVESIWRRSSSPAAVITVVKFLHLLRRVLPPSIYAEFKVEPSASDFLRDTDSALIEEAANALIDGRLRDLEGIFALVMATDDGGERLLSRLRDICQSRPSDVLPEAVEWVARHVETPSSRVKSPRAVDESQSSALDYVSVCLLTAWDAALGGGRSAQVLENIRRLARELYKVDLTGAPGEVVVYDERQHELRPQVTPTPQQVELVRPGVRWSDGIRTRFLVRAVVKPATAKK